MYKLRDADPRPHPMELCNTHLVCDGSSIRLIVRVLLNIWYLVLLLYVCTTSAEQKHEKRGLAHYQQQCTLHTCTCDISTMDIKMYSFASGV